MPSTVLVLNNEQMEGLISMREAIDAMEIAYRDLGEGVARLIPRYRIQLPKKTQPGVDYWFNNIPAAVPAFNTMALRIDSAGVRVREVAGMVRKDFPGDYVGLVLLFDIETNALTAMLFDHYLSPIRVAATSALVAKYLARQQASVVGLFGTGEQARAHAEAFCEIRKVKRIKVYSPTRANREAFAREMTGRLDVQVQAVDDPRAVVEGVEIVIAATNSNEPVFKGEWLEPGTHVVTIRGSDRHVKQRETDPSTARRADIIAINDRAQVKLDGQPELLELLDQGLLRWEALHDVTEFVLGRAPVRQDERQITVHYNNVGMGIQFAAVGAIIEKKARSRGVGTEIPADLFITRKGGGLWSP